MGWATFLSGFRVLKFFRMCDKLLKFLKQDGWPSARPCWPTALTIIKFYEKSCFPNVEILQDLWQTVKVASHLLFTTITSHYLFDFSPLCVFKFLTLVSNNHVDLVDWASCEARPNVLLIFYSLQSQESPGVETLVGGIFSKKKIDWNSNLSQSLGMSYWQVAQSVKYVTLLVIYLWVGGWSAFL